MHHWLIGKIGRQRDPGLRTPCNALRVLHPTNAVVIAVAVRAATVAFAFEVAVAVQFPVERVVTAMPEADKVRRLSERNEV